MTATAAPGIIETMGAAPTCVKPDLNDGGVVDYLTVTNTCGSAQRVKVVLANASDLSCQNYEPGQSRSWRWGFPGRFDGLVTC